MAESKRELLIKDGDVLMTVGKQFDSEGDVEIEVEGEHNTFTTLYANRKQITQLRDHLNKLLDA